MAKTQVAITGMGVTCALGLNVEDVWAKMKAGESAIGPFKNIDHADDLRVNVGAELPGPVDGGIEERHLAAFDRFSLIALDSAREAIAQSGLSFDDPELAARTDCIIGNGAGGWQIVEESFRNIFLKGMKRTHVLTVPRYMPSAAASQISMQLGIKGANYAVASACASSNHAVAMGYRSVVAGDCDVAIVGGAEHAMIWSVLKSWEALRVLTPDTCRPFSLNRRGLTLADGGGVIVLESMEHAKARGAKILAELAGGGMSSDAADLVAPTVEGPARALKNCLRSADLSPADVDYINAHGTGTKANDATETKVIREVFGKHADDLSVSSTKSMHGHALGGTGGVEIIACIKAINDGIVPPTANHDEPDPECDLDVTPNTAKQRNIDVALSNAFAFGGTNCVLAVKRA